MVKLRFRKYRKINGRLFCYGDIIQAIDKDKFSYEYNGIRIPKDKLLVKEV